MVRRSIPKRFGAIALVAASVVTFFAPVEAPAQSAEDLLPPGLCTKERHRQLQDIVEAAWKLVDRCSSPPDTIEIMSDKVVRFRDTIIARENINNECFGGGNPGHKQQIKNLDEGMINCQKSIAKKKKHEDRCPGK